jgi:hypothetical protein
LKEWRLKQNEFDKAKGEFDDVNDKREEKKKQYDTLRKNRYQPFCRGGVFYRLGWMSLWLDLI